MSATLWFRTVGLCTILAALAVVALISQPDAQARDETKGKKYALLVGVNDYKGDGFAPLKFCENDVEKLAELLVAAGFEKKNVRVLTNARGKVSDADKPTAANIKAAIDKITEDKARGDTVLFAFSGHGANVEVPDPEGR